MTTAISLSGYGKLNVTRVTKMLNTTNKEEATKLGKIDKFAELFRWNKKYDKLCFLYDNLHAGIDSESTAPEAQQESNLNRIVIFHRMEKLTKSDNSHQSYAFETCLFDDGRELIFKINDKIVYDTSQNIRDTKCSANERTVFTSDSIAEIKQVVDMLDAIDQNTFDKKYHITFYEAYSAIEHCKGNDFTNRNDKVDSVFINVYMNYITKNLAEVPKFNFLEFKVKSSDKQNLNKHSIIFYKFGDKYHILIKPNIKRSTYISDNDEYFLPSSFDVPLKSGANKIVKTLGIEIILSDDKKLEGIKHVVTTVIRGFEDEDNSRRNITDLVKDGYRLVMFKNAKNSNGFHSVWVQDYLGEDLSELLQLKSFPLEQRLEIIRLHWKQVSIDRLKYNDNKLNNVLLKMDKTSLGYEIHIIDYVVETCLRYAPNRLCYERLSEEQQLGKIQIFQFINMYYQIYQNDTEDVNGLVTTVLSDRSVNELNLSKKNPFAEPLQRAWRCELDWDECKNVVNKILYPGQYTGSFGGVEASVVELLRIYA